jgi:hypothetical protein
MLHSPLFVYYEINQEQSNIQILHFWHVSRKPPRL